MTRRLSTSPACLVSEEYEMSRHLERILDAAGQKIDAAKPILEINPDHPMVARLAAETEASRQQDWANLIFDQALLSEGGRLEDPAGFVRRMNELIVTLAQGGGSKPARRAGEDGERRRRRRRPKTSKKAAERSGPGRDGESAREQVGRADMSFARGIRTGGRVAALRAGTHRPFRHAGASRLVWNTWSGRGAARNRRLPGDRCGISTPEPLRATMAPRR